MNNTKRRDNKGRVLRTGEQQRADGRYMFICNNPITGKQIKPVYSWKLEKTDKVPSGKTDSLSLREKEEQIREAFRLGIEYHAGNTTVLSLVERYVSLRTGVTHNTKAGYGTVVNWLKKDPFGNRRIDTIKISDAKEWLINLQSVEKKSYSSIHSIRGVVRPAFQMAVDDDLIPKNPFDFEFAKLLIDDSVTRNAITPKQERMFLDFIKNDKHYCQYYDGMYILFHTGMRISEFVGLTFDDIDMKERTITVEHQLQRERDGTYVIVKTKTEAGERVLPMTDEVYQCFKNLIANRKKVKQEFEVDGYKGFLVLDKNGRPYLANHWEKRFQYALGKYNRTYKKELPPITPHVCRHTYCTNAAKSGMSIKTLQYLMGHSDISVTLGIYTHANAETAREEVERLKKEGVKL